MTTWHRTWRGDISLRVAGLFFCWLSYNAFLRLVSLCPPPPKDALPYLLAGVVFVAASAGLAMLALGRHLFDDVVVSGSWHRGAEPDPNDAAMISESADRTDPRSRSIGGTASLSEGRFTQAERTGRGPETLYVSAPSRTEEARLG